MHMKNTSPQYGLFCCFYKVQLYRKISWYDSFILSYIWLLQNCRKNMREKNREEKSEKKKYKFKVNKLFFKCISIIFPLLSKD